MAGSQLCMHEVRFFCARPARNRLESRSPCSWGVRGSTGVIVGHLWGPRCLLGSFRTLLGVARGGCLWSVLSSLIQPFDHSIPSQAIGTKPCASLPRLPRSVVLSRISRSALRSLLFVLTLSHSRHSISRPRENTEYYVQKHTHPLRSHFSTAS